MTPKQDHVLTDMVFFIGWKMQTDEFLGYWKILRNCFVVKRLESDSDVVSNIFFFEACEQYGLIPELTYQYINPILKDFLYELGFAYQYIRHRKVTISADSYDQVSYRETIDPNTPIDRINFVFNEWSLTNLGKIMVSDHATDEEFRAIIERFKR